MDERAREGVSESEQVSGELALQQTNRTSLTGGRRGSVGKGRLDICEWNNEILIHCTWK